MASNLQQLLSKLDAPGPAQLYAVTSVFNAAASSPPSAAEPAIRQCLCLGSGAAVAVAVDQLLALVRSAKIEADAAHSLLRTALAVAHASTAGPLATGAADLFDWQVGKSGGVIASGTSWRQHPLAEAMLSSPHAGPPLLSRVCSHLSASLRKDPASLSTYQPFFQCVSLDRELGGQQPQMPSAARAALVRLGCALNDAPAAQHAVLSMLVGALPALPVHKSQDQAAAACYLGDVLDLLEACEQEPGEVDRLAA